MQGGLEESMLNIAQGLAHSRCSGYTNSALSFLIFTSALTSDLGKCLVHWSVENSGFRVDFRVMSSQLEALHSWGVGDPAG